MSDDLRHIIKILSEQSALPKKIDVSKIGNRYWISSYDTMASDIVSESIYTGMSNIKETATLKSLTEKVERLAIIEGARKGRPACQTERSDGFACLPRIYPDSTSRVRENALNEAIERFAWATWWDDDSIKFERFNYLDKIKDTKDHGTLLEMAKVAQFELPYCIVPTMALKNKMVAILIAPLSNGGFVSGGACGDVDRLEEIFMRALDELFRHAIGVQKMKRDNLKPGTFYEKRLAFFGLGHGDNLVNRRLAANGNRPIQLPELKIDEEIPHTFNHDFVVHRCLYENQPPFVGGSLERLCL